MPPTLESVSKKRKLDEVFQGHNVPPYRENATQYAPDHLLLHHSETVDGFIKTRRHNRKVVDAVVKFVEDVKGALSTMESLGFPSLHDAERELQGRGVSVPFDSALGDVSESQKVTFHPPNQIEIGGGLSHRFLPKFQNHTPVADLIIGISSSFFAPEDYLDFRYFRKRAAYMAYIASALLDLSSNRTCSFDFLDGDGLRPIVIINSPNVKATVRIIPAISSDLFPMDKLSSSSCCAWRDIGASTAQYNASIIADAYHLENTERHRRLAASHPGFEGGLVLGSAWLSHRSYSSHLLDGGFGDNEWALLQSYIIGNNVDPKSSQHLSDPFQLFMSVLRLIEKTEPTASPIDEANFALCTLNETSYNILFKISQWTYLALRHDAIAALSLRQLGFSTRNQFRRIFVEGESQAQQDFDLVAIFPIEMSDISEQLPRSWVTQWSMKRTISNYCYNIFSQGLGSRCKKMILSLIKENPRNIRELSNIATGVVPQTTELRAFMTLNEKNSNHDTDYGPSLENSAESAKFREFWQEKSELRRFRDGQILETVRWSQSSSPAEQILSFLSQRITCSSNQSNKPHFRGPQFEHLLASKESASRTGVSFKQALSDFSNLINIIREMRDFPLGFKAVHGISPGFRFASVHPPSTYLNTSRNPESTIPQSSHFRLPYDAEIELESSPGWPIDREQRRRCELGLLLRLWSELQRTGKVAWTRPGIEPIDPAKCEIVGFLDILTQENYYFRIRLRDLNQSRGIPAVPVAIRTHSVNHRLCNADDEDKTQIRRDFIYRKSKQHLYFSPTVRLVKKWFQSHLLASFFSDDMLELFGSLGFKVQSPETIPGSAFCGFNRVITELSRWDWRKRPLGVEVMRAFSDREQADLLSDFEAHRLSSAKSDEIGLFAAVACADGTIDWVESFVPCSVAARMTHLAREAHAKLLGFSVPPLDLFTPNLAFFDFLIKLLPRPAEEDFKTYTNGAIGGMRSSPINLPQLLCEELKALVGGYVVLFPAFEGRIIGCLWKPTQSIHSYPIPTGTYARHNNGTLKTTEEVLYNKPTILESIRIVGTGCIEDIYMKIEQPE